MNKFWKWMKEKEYGKKDRDGEWIGHEEIHPYYFRATKQMLIGYMIEYVNNHKFWEIIKGEKDYEHQERCMQLDFEFRMAAKCRDIYKELERIIKELDR